MKLLIVDDEDIIREGLVSNIPWEENGFSLTTPGINGRDAMEIIEREHPDIVLADINMPFVNGLELAEWIQDRHPEIKVIFLTGYDEFQYARKAIELKASAYILKYEKHENLIQEVKNVAAELEKDRAGKQLQSRARAQLALQTVSNLIIGFARMSSRSAVLNSLEMEDGQWKYCFALIDVSLDTPVDEDKPNENGLYLFSYINVVKEVCEAYGERVLCGSYDNQIYVIFAEQGKEKEHLASQARDALVEARKKLEDFLKIQGKVGVSGVYEDILQTDIAYNSAYMALQSGKNSGSRDMVCVQKTDTRRASGNAIMKEIEEYIHENYAIAGLSLNDLSEFIHLSPAHLCRLIKKYENTNFMTWLTKVRVEVAAELIKSTDMKVYEVCERVGYNNPQYFSVVFKKYMGCSPREYN